MVDRCGWLLDVYTDETDGLVIWFLGEDGRRRRFTQSFPITFYAAGAFDRLRAAWRYLRGRHAGVSLARTQREDLFARFLPVMAVTLANPAAQPTIFYDLRRRFPDLDYYDADIPIWPRFAAAYDLFPLAYCQITVNDNGRIQHILPLESPWQVAPTPPPLRILTIEPDIAPFHAEPTYVRLRCGRIDTHIPLRPWRLLLIQLQAAIKRHDPDLILTHWGDTWLFPTLLARAEQEQVSFNPNRDVRRRPLRRPENSYFTYGQVVYRGQQVHLYGRWHIDQQNAMMYGDYGLAGVFEQARVTGLPVQEIARKSPGAGITAMQMITALRHGILVPYQKQQVEAFKSARDLIRSDRGGLVYQPLIGLHRDVAELDFVSMYPSIMVHFNISPETIGRPAKGAQMVPELGIPVDQSQEGLVPKTLRPLLLKRIAIKKQLAAMNRHDCRYKVLKARAAALKWLLVVCFGYLGYKNARFGRIESHEAVTAYGREALLRAKEAAEDLGFTVLHMYVDGIWVQQPGHKQPEDFTTLQQEIQCRTGLPIALEGVYRWLAFLPSRLDKRVPVANRYFGVFQNGIIKMRGIETRRRDTPPWIAQVQLEVLEQMTAVPEGEPLESCLPVIFARLRQHLANLRTGQVPLVDLLVSQSISRELDAYRVPSPAARAARQLEAVGKHIRPGQRIRFIYTYGKPGVQAWDRPRAAEPNVNRERYADLLLRAVTTVLQPLCWEETAVRECLSGHARQMAFTFLPAATSDNNKTSVLPPTH